VVAQSPEPGAHVTNARLFNSTMDKDQSTTPGTTRPTLCDKCVGSLTSPANQNNEDAGDGAYGLSSLSETVASCLMRSSPDRAVHVQALAGDSVLCSWARHLTLTVPISTQWYKGEPANLIPGVTLLWTTSRGGVEILLVATCYRNRYKPQPDEPHGS